MNSDLTRILEGFQGQTCWHVAAGAVGYAFSADFGDKIPRSTPFVFRGIPDTSEFGKFRGHVGLMIWCRWRLDGLRAPISSSAEDKKAIEESLRVLIGATVKKATATPPAFDLIVEFDRDMTLRVFCENLPGIDTGSNWSGHLGSSQVLIGPGYTWRIVADPT